MAPLPESTQTEIEALKTRQRKGTLGIVVVVALLAGVGFGAWTLMRTGPCEAVAEMLCGLTGQSCRPLKAAIARAQLPPGRCDAAFREIADLETLPPLQKASGIALATAKLLGGDALGRLIQDADVALGDVERQAAAGMAPSEDLKGKLVGMGSATCSAAIARLKNASGKAHEAIHAVLVALNAGSDLGSTADKWEAWCAEQVVAAAKIGTKP